MEPLRQWRVNIDNELAEKFEAALNRLGMTNKAGTERLLAWYCSADPDVQALLMQVLTPQRARKLARMILREMQK